MRDAAVAEFQSFAATGVLRIALPDLDVPDPAEPWPPTPAVILARAVNAALEDIDDADGPWDRVQRGSPRNTSCWPTRWPGTGIRPG